ncbi:MAG: Spy/CpxP family protein refolding chaperone [Acidobacteria bacterium]|jgi:Spy/CpxP family protein refolding chaperone|nr:Spy/CpxP family protein refolding chaperone [Acidobacteriota bacterium]
MNKKMIFGILGLILVISFFSLTAAMPQRMMEHGRFRIMLAEKNLFPAPVLLMHKNDINLTAEQVNKIEKMQEVHKETMIRKQADIDVKELKLSTYLKEDKIDRGKMESMIREIGNMRTDLQVLHINQLLDMKDILTPEQLMKLDELKRSRLDKRMERMGQRRMGMKNRMGDQPPIPVE